MACWGCTAVSEGFPGLVGCLWPDPVAAPSPSWDLEPEGGRAIFTFTLPFIKHIPISLLVVSPLVCGEYSGGVDVQLLHQHLVFSKIAQDLFNGILVGIITFPNMLSLIRLSSLSYIQCIAFSPDGKVNHQTSRIFLHTGGEAKRMG